MEEKSTLLKKALVLEEVEKENAKLHDRVDYLEKQAIAMNQVKDSLHKEIDELKEKKYNEREAKRRQEAARKRKWLSAYPEEEYKVKV